MEYKISKIKQNKRGKNEIEFCKKQEQNKKNKKIQKSIYGV